LWPRPERGVGRGTFSTPPGWGSVSDLGSTPSFFGATPMTRRRFKTAAQEPTRLTLPFPFDAVTWAQVVVTLTLPPQQARIIERILCGMGDKQIARDLNLSVPTVRTYLGRIFNRLGVGDRVQLILRIFAEARQITDDNGCRQL